jgi:hypothetical protein
MENVVVVLYRQNSMSPPSELATFSPALRRNSHGVQTAMVRGARRLARKPVNPQFLSRRYEKDGPKILAEIGRALRYSQIRTHGVLRRRRSLKTHAELPKSAAIGGWRPSCAPRRVATVVARPSRGCPSWIATWTTPRRSCRGSPASLPQCDGNVASRGRMWGRCRLDANWAAACGGPRNLGLRMGNPNWSEVFGGDPILMRDAECGALGPPILCDPGVLLTSP